MSAAHLSGTVGLIPAGPFSAWHTSSSVGGPRTLGSLWNQGAWPGWVRFLLGCKHYRSTVYR